MVNDKNVLLEVKNLTVEFGNKNNKFKAVDDVSFNIYKGETFGLVGESGSGKTTIGRSIIRINEITSGTIKYNGETISGKIKKSFDKMLTQKIQMIFQDPMSSLNERAKVDYIISEGLYNTGNYSDENDRILKVQSSLNDVGLLYDFASRFPHEFSGGQRQRIGIARALVMEPEFIIADEPISALDVSIRAQVLNLLIKLQKDKNLTYLFIAHDLSVMKHFTDRIAVIYKGKIVELASTEELFKNPLHDYTKALMSAIPNPNPNTEKNKKLIIFKPKTYDFLNDPPVFREISPNHFILWDSTETSEYLNSSNNFLGV